jgi:hypothetical protein
MGKQLKKSEKVRQLQPNLTNPKQFALQLLFYNPRITRLTDFKVEYQIQPEW